MLSPGALLAGRYRLLRELGRGGMGVVWHARNEAIDRQVALKVMVPALAASEEALRRFFTEARICGGIRHPGIVDVLDLGRAEDGTPFLVMELLEGVSLETVLERRRSLPPAMACRLVRDVAATVALAHDRGIVHRDLKPGNIFIQRPTFGPLVVKVLDFGISKMLGDHSANTSAGVLVGTPAYMSPEQASGLPDLDHRVDVYALGVILYELLSGSLPHQGPTAQALLLELATKAATPITVHAPDLSPLLVEVVETALARDRQHRFADARALASHLDRVMAALRLDPEALDELAPPPSPTLQPRPSSGALDTTPRGGVPMVSEAEPPTAPRPEPRPTTDPTMRSGEDPVPARPAALVATVSGVSAPVGHGANRTWVGGIAGAALAAAALLGWWFLGRGPQPSEVTPASTASTDASSLAAAEAPVDPAPPQPSATGPAEAAAASATPSAAATATTATSAPVLPATVSPRPASKRPATSAPPGASKSEPDADRGIWEYE